MPKIHFATNRAPNRKDSPDSFGNHPSTVAIDDLRFGTATVENGEITGIAVAPERITGRESRRLYGSASLFSELQESMAKGADCLCFVHGYNVSFEEALIAGAGLEEIYGKDKALEVLVYSWPSDGSMLPFLAYKRDRDDARASGPALGRALLKLRDFLCGIDKPCGQRIHLLCHSMGNYVLRNALQSLGRESGLCRLFDEIFLVAADEDHDAFEHEHKLAMLPELAQSVQVYFNRGDTALVVSDRTKNNPTRLGSRGPRLPLAVPGNVTIVDTSLVVGGLVEHSYVWDEDRVIADLREVLEGIPADRIEDRSYLASQNRYVLEAQ